MISKKQAIATLLANRAQIKVEAALLGVDDLLLLPPVKQQATDPFTLYFYADPPNVLDDPVTLSDGSAAHLGDTDALAAYISKKIGVSTKVYTSDDHKEYARCSMKFEGAGQRKVTSWKHVAKQLQPLLQTALPSLFDSTPEALQSTFEAQYAAPGETSHTERLAQQAIGNARGPSAACKRGC
jgi:hypothetical protein